MIASLNDIPGLGDVANMAPPRKGFETDTNAAPGGPIPEHRKIFNDPRGLSK